MLKLNIIDKMFDAPSAGSRDDIENPFIHWNRDFQSHDFVVVTDNSLNDPSITQYKTKIAWLFESPNPKKRIFYRLRKSRRFKSFERVFTHDRRLVNCGEKFTFCPVGGSWLSPDEWQLYPKTRNLSIIASSKNNLPGHQLRHQVIETYGEQIGDLYGRPHRFVERKVDALKDHRYSLVIENQRMDYYFTEKLIDSFAAGTIPIYWGCPSLEDFFDMDGVIQFQHASELEAILAKLSAEDYINRLPAIQRNFETAKNYRFPEKGLRDALMQHADLLKGAQN